MVPARIEGGVSGDVDDLHQHATQPFAGSPGRGIVRVTCDPKWIQTESAGDRKEESAGAFGVVFPAECRVDLVSDVPAVEQDAPVVAAPEFDFPHDFVRESVLHIEEIGGRSFQSLIA